MRQYDIAIDIDDTLVLTERACFDLENEVLKKMGRNAMSREVHLRTWGQPLFDIITTRSPGVNVAEFKRFFTPLMQQFIHEGRLDKIPSQNLAILDRLKQAGRRLFILTSRTMIESEHLLHENSGLSDKIAGFYHRDNTHHHKPDPRVFDPMIKDHNLNPKNMIYVGDSPSDHQAAIGAGMKCIVSLESGIRKIDEFYPVPDGVINSFVELPEAVAQLEGV